VSAGSAAIRLIVADDHAIVREGLLALLATAPDIVCVSVAADGAEAIEQVGQHLPDVVLMDLAMPGVDGVRATRTIAERHPRVQVIILTSYGDETRIRAALDAGARGYLLKHVGPDELLDAVRVAHRGGVPLDPRAGRALLEMGRRPGPALTPRESEVLGLVAQGLTNRRIGRQLGISERTVKAHLTRIMAGIGVTDRVQAALWARDHLPVA
jgi:DNA-binding NarL/FixJ family response regulator